MTFGERLVKAREDAGYNQKQLANVLGITPTRLNYWEKNKREPDVYNINQIASALNISADYLIGNNTANIYSGMSGNLSQKEQEHIKKYRVLDEHGKEMVDVVLDKEYKRYQKIQEAMTISSSIPKTKENIAPLQEQKIIYLPEPLQSASAGTGQLADDDTAEQVAVYYNEVTSKADYIMRVSGDSMEPKFIDGDRVLVRSQPSVEIGEIGIFIRDSERFIKIYRGSYLESINPKYGDVSLEEYSYCLGKVLGVLKPEWIAE